MSFMKTWKQFRDLHPNFNLEVFLRRRNLKTLEQAKSALANLSISCDEEILTQILGPVGPFVVSVLPDTGLAIFEEIVESPIRFKVDIEKRIKKSQGMKYDKSKKLD